MDWTYDDLDILYQDDIVPEEDELDFDAILEEEYEDE